MCQMDRLLCQRQSDFVKLRKLNAGPAIKTQLMNLPDAPAKLVSLTAALPPYISTMAQC